MKKFLTIIGAVVRGVAAIAGTVYAVLYFQRKREEEAEDCCYIDDECGCGCNDDYEDYDEAFEDDEEDEGDTAGEPAEDAE